MRAVQVSNLTLAYNVIHGRHIQHRQVLFDNLDLDVADGEFFSIVGPSGSGKSTLLNLIGGLDTIADPRRVRVETGNGGRRRVPVKEGSGSVWVAGEDITRLRGAKKADFINRNIGFVFQFHHLIPELTALENVALPLRIAGHSRRAAEARAGELLGKLEMDGNGSKRPAILSGGESQRVAIARALVTGPRILLADEPTGSVPIALKEEIIRIFADLNRHERMTILLITHDSSLLTDRTGAPLFGRVFDLGEHQEVESAA